MSTSDTLSGRQFCPYVQRAWITLEERGIPYQYKEVNPYKKEKHFLGASCLPPRSTEHAS